MPLSSENEDLSTLVERYRQVQFQRLDKKKKKTAMVLLYSTQQSLLYVLSFFIIGEKENESAPEAAPNSRT